MKFCSTPNKTVILLTAMLFFKPNTVIGQIPTEKSLAPNCDSILNEQKNFTPASKMYFIPHGEYQT